MYLYVCTYIIYGRARDYHSIKTNVWTIMFQTKHFAVCCRSVRRNEDGSSILFDEWVWSYGSNAQLAGSVQFFVMQITMRIQLHDIYEISYSKFNF